MNSKFKITKKIKQPAFGEISYHDGGFDTVLDAQDTYYQIAGFDTNGFSNNTTPDQANNHITIMKPGKYLVSFNASVRSSASNSYEFHIFKNNGTIEFNNIGSHRKTSVANALGALSGSGIIDLDVNDTVELWVQRTDGAAVTKTITTQHVTIYLEQISD